MKLSDFHFDLPAELIARFPAEKRDQSRLMVVDRRSGEISHRVFKDIIGLIGVEDFMVVNTSRVIPVKFFGEIDSHPVEVLVVRRLDETRAEALTMPARRFREGVQVHLGRHIRALVEGPGPRGRRTLRFNEPLEQVMKQGFAPLPPYIKRKFPEALVNRDLDLSRYQTVYSRHPGSIAAPTAGLHFSKSLLGAIKKKVTVLEINLDVGEATFQKIEADDIRNHRMGRETITISRDTRLKIKTLRESRKLLAVGTTTVRALETLCHQNPEPDTFESDLFISPGFQFRAVDRMITNFHLPQSSLFILVSAFAGLELMRHAYRIAIENRYRFFSYGDAMLIL